MSVSVFEVRRTEETGLEEALGRLPTLPFRRGFGLSKEVAVSAARHELDEVLRHGSDRGRVVLAERSGEILGGLGIRIHDFESDLFGFRVARTSFCFVHADREDLETRVAGELLAAALDICEGWGVRHWSVLVSVDEDAIVREASSAGWHLADSTLTFTWDVSRPATRTGACDESIELRAADESDADVLSEIARRAYTGFIRTRYAADPRIPLETTGDLYAGWAARACDGTFADAVSVAEVDGRVAGFDMIKLNRGLSQVTGVGFAGKGIAAVVPEFRGRRVFSCVDAWLNRWQYDHGGGFNNGRVLINNIPMQRACSRVGGVVTAAHHTFHVWLDGSRGS